MRLCWQVMIKLNTRGQAMSGWSGLGLWAALPGCLCAVLACGPGAELESGRAAKASASISSHVVEVAPSQWAGEEPTAAKAAAEVFEVDPIAAVGHGAVFGLQGEEIVLSETFIRSAQAYYLARFEGELPAELAGQYDEQRQLLISELGEAGFPEGLLDSWLIDLLIGLTQPLDAAAMRSKNAFLRMGYGKIFEGVYELPQSVVDMLEAGGVLLPSPDPVNGALAYIEECRDADVPIPPDWGTPGWGLEVEPTDDYLNAGMLLEGVFAAPGYEVRVWTYESQSPPGVCIALPRWSGNRIALLGIICLGTESSNACFWDQAPARPGEPRAVLDPVDARGQVVPLEQFVSGPELARGWDGGTCSDCHAGENPFVVHPYTPLADSAQTAGRWYRPLVDASWPQNPGPTNLLAGVTVEEGMRACTECHFRESAGRFPEVSGGQLPNYCVTVLKSAIRRSMPPLGPPWPDPTPNPLWVRPIWEYFPQSAALYSACGLGPLNPSAVVSNFDWVEDLQFVSRPIAGSPFYACATRIEVTGAIRHAELRIYIDDDWVASQEALDPESQAVNVPALLAGQVLTISQVIDGVESERSPPVTVRSHLDDYPEGLPAPAFASSPVYECGNRVGIRNVPGAHVTVYTNGTSPVLEPSSGPFTSVTPGLAPLQLDDELIVQQTLCDDSSPFSEKVLAQAAPSLPWTPSFDDLNLYEGQELVRVSGLTQGVQASVSVLEGALSADFSEAMSWHDAVDLESAMGRGLLPGEVVHLEQMLCSAQSLPEAFSEPVRPCSELPAPQVETLAKGDIFLTVKQAVPGARIFAYDESGQEIADGSGPVVMTRRPFEGNEIIAVRQQVGTCDGTVAYETVVHPLAGVPEPTASGLWIAGLIGLGVLSRRSLARRRPVR